MGLELAKSFFRNGARVTIMARTQSKLDAALQTIRAQKQAKAQKQAQAPQSDGAVEAVAVDVTDYAKVVAAMDAAVAKQGGAPIHTLVMSAGRSTPGYFLEQDVAVFDDAMRLNYFGSLHCAKAVAPMMIASGTKGKLLFVSSAASAASFLGYTSYAPTKFAVRGLADGLRNELCGFGIGVHIAYPPDTDTPGFEEENKGKPVETNQISPPEVYSAEKVADGMLDGLLRGEFHLPSPDLVQNFLVSTTVNITPRGRWAPVELLLSPVLGIAMLFFKVHADSCARVYGKRELDKLAKLAK